MTSRLICVGVNHRRAPVELREKVAFSADGVEAALEQMRELDGVTEALVLSTCNRVELYAAGDPDTTPYQLSTFLQRFHQLSEAQLDEHLFRLVGEDAVSHLFRVASSLDAIVVGEPQILGQVKEAYFKAAGKRATGPVLRNENNAGLSSPDCRSSFDRSIVRASSRGGVPVLRRPSGSPRPAS